VAEVQGMVIDQETAADPQFQWYLTTWRGFTRFVQVMTATVILVVAILAIVTL
jgi:hypothetical protein